MKLKRAVLKTPFNCPLISQVSELRKYSASQLLRHLMLLSLCIKGALVMSERDRLKGRLFRLQEVSITLGFDFDGHSQACSQKRNRNSQRYSFHIR